MFQGLIITGLSVVGVRIPPCVQTINFLKKQPMKRGRKITYEDSGTGDNRGWFLSLVYDSSERSGHRGPRFLIEMYGGEVFNVHCHFVKFKEWEDDRGLFDEIAKITKP